MKYVVVTGGVISGLGKGISISSIGVLLKSAGLKVTAMKIDPYLNSDAGTMSPFEHGEVFVLNDGGEADLDLGNYERFLDITLTRDHNITTGKVYSQVINAERRGDYLGKTVQVIPHVTDAIQDWIARVSHLPVERPGTAADAGGLAGYADDDDTLPDVCLVEVGGTVGDIESLVFLEALRQFATRVGHDNFVLVHVSLVPEVGVVGEQKTKPTQHSVKELRSLGLSPDILICRAARELTRGTKEKLGVFCQVPADAVFSVHDVPNIFHVPLILHDQHCAEQIARRLNLRLPTPPSVALFKHLAASVDSLTETVTIALVGKYTGLTDSYLSVIKALQHAAIAASRKLIVSWVDAAALEERSEREEPTEFADSWRALEEADGILVPGGFGDRGVEGKIRAITYARKALKPFLGICLGMQCAVIEYARNKLGMTGANSAEFARETPHPVVIFMPEIDARSMGGTMRLGARPTTIRGRTDGKPSLAADLYGRDVKMIWERHRHRYEVNPEYEKRIAAAGLHFTGTDERRLRMEIVELDRAEHPFFFACQYHPEFQSHPMRPSPPFAGLILAASGQLSSHLPLASSGRRHKGLAVGHAGDGAAAGGAGAAAPDLAVATAAADTTGAAEAASAGDAALPQPSPRASTAATAAAAGSSTPAAAAAVSGGAPAPASASRRAADGAASPPRVGLLMHDRLGAVHSVVRPYEGASPSRAVSGDGAGTAAAGPLAPTGSAGAVLPPPILRTSSSGAAAAALSGDGDDVALPAAAGGVMVPTGSYRAGSC